MERSDIFGPRLAGRRVKTKRNYNESDWRRIKLFKDFKEISIAVEFVAINGREILTPYFSTDPTTIVGGYN
jgi:hypothetical protein